MFGVDQRHGRSGIGGVGLAGDVGRIGRGRRAVGADHDVAVESVEGRVGAPLDPARELRLDQREKPDRSRDPQGARPHAGAGALHVDAADFGHEGRIVGEAAGGADEGIVEFADKSRQSAGQRRGHARRDDRIQPAALGGVAVGNVAVPAPVAGEAALQRTQHIPGLGFGVARGVGGVVQARRDQHRNAGGAERRRAERIVGVGGRHRGLEELAVEDERGVFGQIHLERPLRLLGEAVRQLGHEGANALLLPGPVLAAAAARAPAFRGVVVERGDELRGGQETVRRARDRRVGHVEDREVGGGARRALDVEVRADCGKLQPGEERGIALQHARPHAGVKSALVVGHAVVVRIIRRHHQLGPALVKHHAARERKAHPGGVARTRAIAVGGGNLEAAVVAAEDDIHDAAGGVGPVDRARRAGQELDAFDGREGDGIEVGLAGRGGRSGPAGQAPAVDEDERIGGAETAGIDHAHVRVGVADAAR